MDEAERCHKLAYIFNGNMLAQGTSDEVVASQKLSTWLVHGEDLAILSEKLQKTDGVSQTVLFGSTLHVSGLNSTALEAELRQAVAGTTWKIEPIETGLEDVFIHLMKSANNHNGVKA